MYASPCSSVSCRMYAAPSKDVCATNAPISTTSRSRANASKCAFNNSCSGASSVSSRSARSPNESTLCGGGAMTSSTRPNIPGFRSISRLSRAPIGFNKNFIKSSTSSYSRASSAACITSLAVARPTSSPSSLSTTRM